MNGWLDEECRVVVLWGFVDMVGSYLLTPEPLELAHFVSVFNSAFAFSYWQELIRGRER